jgi:hypothetical protein
VRQPLLLLVCTPSGYHHWHPYTIEYQCEQFALLRANNPHP